MPQIKLADVKLPEFGVPEVRPEIPAATYAERIERFRRRVADAGIDLAIVYADREHFANIAYLTGFEPRFEEALLILAPGKTPVVVTGPENQGYAPVSPLDLALVLYPPFGLLGQDRRKTPPLADVLAAAGVGRGKTVGVAGWKFFGPSETATPETWVDAPAYIVDTLRTLVGDTGRVVNATRVLMDSTTGMRAVNEIDQLAQFEFSACQASEAVKRVIFGLRPGMSEFDAARLMAPIGLPYSCHPVLASGERMRLGLASPSNRTLAEGEPFAVAVGVWGALTCRVGFLVRDAGGLPAVIGDYVERLAAPYFACAAEWYETVGIGVRGGDIDAMVRRHLGDPFFGLILNPGHLIHLDEWLNTPIYPQSEERLLSGQAIQVDIIPATGSDYASINIEDGIALLDAEGRAEFRDRYPQAWGRIEARRAFMADVLGIRPKPEVLPFSNLAGYLPPFLLSPGTALVRR
ncbi:MAG TPA: aminopeptidase P family N-terminal domain-containing protein [Bauldia sp.]|nr:aminopeptidase P family N-terminal domain-containing protein [Bauldia sp.]